MSEADAVDPLPQPILEGGLGYWIAGTRCGGINDCVLS